jgi:hypothetical protein
MSLAVVTLPSQKSWRKSWLANTSGNAKLTQKIDAWGFKLREGRVALVLLLEPTSFAHLLV